MKKKLAAVVALVLCLGLVLGGCGVVNTKYAPQNANREITGAVNIAEGLVGVTGSKLTVYGGSAKTTAPLFAVAGEVATSSVAGTRETRVYDYSTGKQVVGIVDTSDSHYYVREFKDNSVPGFTQAIVVYSEPTEAKMANESEKENPSYSHYFAIYTRSGDLITEKTEVNSSSSNTIDIWDLCTPYVFGNSDSSKYFLRTIDNSLWEFDADGKAERVTTDMPFYNSPMDYDYKANGNYYVADSSKTMITVYDGKFDRVGSVVLPYGVNVAEKGTYVLSGGNLIYQYHTIVPDTEKNYDIAILSGSDIVRYNLSTYLVDPIKGKIKKIKTNYCFTRVYNRIEDEEMFEAYTDSVENIAVALEVKDKTVSFADFALISVGNNGKIGGSVGLVDRQNEVVTTYDGKYFIANDVFGITTVFDRKLKKVASYKESVLDKYDKVGAYLYDDEERVIYDYAFKKIYEAKKDQDGAFVEDIDFYGIANNGCRITTIDNSVEDVMTFSVIDNGVKKELRRFASDSDETLVFNGDTDFYGQSFGGQFWCTYRESDGKYCYYNFAGVKLLESTDRLEGYAVSGGCSIIFSASSGEFWLLR